MAKFSSRFGGGPSTLAKDGEGDESGKKPEEGVFGLEGDLSWLDGVTLQSPSGGLGKKDIVGPAKKEKKGKK